jgi:hypothetical protein
MQVGVYIDGFNLYYGGRGLCGKGTPGWRWLDLRALAERVITNHSTWAGATIHRVIYCTAVISGADNPVGNREQDVYLRALKRAQVTDRIELGTYVRRVATAPLPLRPQRSASPHKPNLANHGQRRRGPGRSAGAVLRISRAPRGKGSDVNVAAHLLLDILEQRIDAAVVISNDSDLKFAVDEARKRGPGRADQPSKSALAGRLRGDHPEPASATTGGTN